MTSANTNDQVRENTWHEINELHGRHGWPGECLTQSWKLEDGAKAVGYTTDVEQALQGKHEEAFLLEVDESSGERLDDSWPIYKTLVSGAGQIILVGHLDRRSGTFAEASEGKYGLASTSCASRRSRRTASRSRPGDRTLASRPRRRRRGGGRRLDEGLRPPRRSLPEDRAVARGDAREHLRRPDGVGRWSEP